MDGVFKQSFKQRDFKAEGLPKQEYEHCKFDDCHFSYTDLSGIKFIDCVFINCDLSLAKLDRTSFQNAQFKNCKMLGMPFHKCETFLLSFYFESCILHHASFYQLKLKKTTFKNCLIHEADFCESDLAQSVFDDCDLSLSRFEQSNLEKVDFSSAFNYSIDPNINRMKKAKFSLSQLPGLLHGFDIEIDLGA